MSPVIFYIAACFTVFCGIALLLTPVLVRQSSANQRVLDVVTNTRPAGQARAGVGLQEKFLQAARSMRGRLGMSQSSKVTKRLLAAGLRKSNASDFFYAAQMTLPIAGLFLGSFMPVNALFWAMAFALVGYMAPDFWLTRKIKARKNTLRRSLPDAVDLLVICVEAGLGLDQALLRVGEELVISHQEISEELTLVNLEQRAGKPRLEAWQSLADRTAVEELQALASMLVQTDRFGTPIIKTLSRFSDDIRVQRRQRAEEAAAKTKIKIIFPLVLCIFPCIFIVLLAPAILMIAEGFKSLGGN